MAIHSGIKRQRAYTGLSFYIVSLLILFASTAADRLSGNFFPPDSPILANFYPNDFLPWGLILFLGLGWISVSLLCKSYKENKRLTITVILVVLIGTILMRYIHNSLNNLWVQSDLQAMWARYLSILVDAWSFAWVFGGIFAYGINVIMPIALNEEVFSSD